MVLLLLLGSFFILGQPSPALAANPVTKLIRGVVNLTTGLLEIPNQMATRKGDGTTVMWTIHGFIEGFATGVARTFCGAYDILTFPVAPYDAPLMDPDTLIAPKHGPDQLAAESNKSSESPHSIK